MVTGHPPPQRGQSGLLGQSNTTFGGGEFGLTGSDTSSQSFRPVPTLVALPVQSQVGGALRRVGVAD